MKNRKQFVQRALLALFAACGCAGARDAGAVEAGQETVPADKSQYHLFNPTPAALMPFPTGVLAEAFQSGNIADQRAAVVLYGIVAGLMSAAWVPIFPYLERQRAKLAPTVPSGYFHAQRSRPWIGVFAYVVAILVGWLINPWLAILIFVLMVIYHAWTSEGVSHRNRTERA